MLAGLPTGARVLDAACGIGIDAAALARRGFDVVACDESPAMVDAARQRLREAGLPVPVSICGWRHLPQQLEPGNFDAVLCVGNSIGHARGEAAMVASLRSFGAMLRPGGVVVVDTHHWEMLAEQGDLTERDPAVIQRDGVSGRRQYRWRWSKEPSRCTIEFQLDLDRDRVAEHRSHPVTLFPFTVADLRARLRMAGFVGVALDASCDRDRYTAVGRIPAS